MIFSVLAVKHWQTKNQTTLWVKRGHRLNHCTRINRHSTHWRIPPCWTEANLQRTHTRLYCILILESKHNRLFLHTSSSLLHRRQSLTNTHIYIRLYTSQKERIKSKQRSAVITVNRCCICSEKRKKPSTVDFTHSLRLRKENPNRLADRLLSDRTRQRLKETTEEDVGRKIHRQKPSLWRRYSARHSIWARFYLLIAVQRLYKVSAPN